MARLAPTIDYSGAAHRTVGIDVLTTHVLAIPSGDGVSWAPGRAIITIALPPVVLVALQHHGYPRSRQEHVRNTSHLARSGCRPFPNATCHKRMCLRTHCSPFEHRCMIRRVRTLGHPTYAAHSPRPLRPSVCLLVWGASQRKCVISICQHCTVTHTAACAMKVFRLPGKSLEKKGVRLRPV